MHAVQLILFDTSGAINWLCDDGMLSNSTNVKEHAY